MGAVGHSVTGQNLADRSTMKLVHARQAADGVTGQIGSYQPHLFVSVKAVLGLRRTRLATGSQPGRANTCGVPRSLVLRQDRKEGSRDDQFPPLIWQESSDSRTIATRGIWDARSVSASIRATTR